MSHVTSSDFEPYIISQGNKEGFLKVGLKHIFFHCIIYRLLYGHMKESKSQNIKLYDTPWEAFKLILQYMYSGKLTIASSIQVKYIICIVQLIALNLPAGPTHIT